MKRLFQKWLPKLKGGCKVMSQCLLKGYIHMSTNLKVLQNPWLWCLRKIFNIYNYKGKQHLGKRLKKDNLPKFILRVFETWLLSRMRSYDQKRKPTN